MEITTHKSLLFHQVSAFFAKHSRPNHSSRFSSQPRCSSARIRPTFAVALDLESTLKSEDSSSFDSFACPICYEPVTRKGPSGFNLYRSGFKCTTFKKSYSSKDIYLDLAGTAGTKEYTKSKPSRTELFRSPFVSFVHERGWRQNFNTSGFPGPG